MKGLLLKDYYCLKQYLRQYVFILIFFVALSFLLKSPTYLIVMSMVCSMSLMFASLQTEDMGGYLYSMTLPVSRKMIVKEKYLFLLLMMLFLFAFSVAGSLVIMACTGFFETGNMIEWMAGNLSVAWIYLIINALIIPVALKWRTEKARFLLLGIIAVPAAIVLIMVQIVGGESLNFWLERLFAVGNGLLVLIIGILVLAGIYAGSYLISQRVFSGKEF